MAETVEQAPHHIPGQFLVETISPRSFDWSGPNVRVNSPDTAHAWQSIVDQVPRFKEIIAFSIFDSIGNTPVTSGLVYPGGRLISDEALDALKQKGLFIPGSYKRDAALVGYVACIDNGLQRFYDTDLILEIDRRRHGLPDQLDDRQIIRSYTRRRWVR